ncbi:MAG: FMN-binding protein [Fibrobacteres bacterium]|nr:FMN-binding protein [Fibrobacterota bacterium]
MNTRNPVYVVLFMIILMVLIGLLLSIINFVTKPTLARNEELLKNRIISRAFVMKPSDESAEQYRKLVTDSIRLEPNGTYLSTDRTRVGFEFIANGFWDKIRGVIVLDSSLSTIVNIQFLEQHETPGLGARIEELEFTDQFKGLKIDKANTSRQLIQIGGTKIAGSNNRVDGITGATQTSLALMIGLNNMLSEKVK